jgi:hypothetical protein
VVVQRHLDDFRQPEYSLIVRLSKLVPCVCALVLVGCGKPPTPHTLYVHLTSNQPTTLTGTISIDDKIQSVHYQAPTNIALTGLKIRFDVGLQSGGNTCDVHFYTDTLLNLPPQARQSATNSVAHLRNGMRHFHLRSKSVRGGAVFRSIADDSSETSEK